MRLKHYVARVKYSFPQDVKEDAPPEGAIVHVHFAFIIDAAVSKAYGQQTAFAVAESTYYLPECDLQIIRECSFEEFQAHFDPFKFGRVDEEVLNG